MFLGKRSRRPPIRRTTSMKEFSPDVVIIEAMITDGGNADAPQPSAEDQPGSDWLARINVEASPAATGFVSPRPHNYVRRSSGDFQAVVETAAFLKACGLCNRRLGPGRDIYIYRGEVAFCSLECRQQLMNQEERNDKCALSSIMVESPSSNVGSEPSSNGGGETVAAA